MVFHVASNAKLVADFLTLTRIVCMYSSYLYHLTHPTP